MRVDPYNIHIMNKMFLNPTNDLFVEVDYSDKENNTITITVEGTEITIPDTYYPEETTLKIALPPDALYIAGDGVGHIDEMYIESVIWKGEHNEIILESDDRKWIMHSDTDEQVATYVPICFDFSKAAISEVTDDEE
jgi:spermidine/putrescine transport system ATP-binding protein